MKVQRLIYWIATIGICGIIAYSAQMYIRHTEMVAGFFTHLNYPEYLVMPLAVAKICAIAMLLWRGVPWLTEWAYAGLFFDISLAALAHYHAQESLSLSLFALILLILLYFFGKEVRPMYL